MITYEICPDCSGDGWTTVKEEIRIGLFVESSIDCDTCGGEGKLEIEPEVDEEEMLIESLVDREDF